jgi:hypothetical protein
VEDNPETGDLTRTKIVWPSDNPFQVEWRDNLQEA